MNGLAAALFLTTASFVLARTGRDALYFQAGGIDDLPLAYLGMAALSLPVAGATLGLMRLAGARRARLIAPVAMAAILLVYASVARPGAGPLMTTFFLFVPLAYGVLFSMTWLLGAEILAAREPVARARAYSRAGAASLAGSLAGAATARLLASSVAPPTLFIIAAGTLAAAMCIVALTQRRILPARLAPGALVRVGPHTLAELFKDRYVRLLAVVGACGALAGVLVEFQFYLAAAAQEPAGHGIALFANLYLVLSLAAFAVQLTLTARVQQRAGLGATLLVLPGTLALVSPAAILSASMMLRAGIRMAEGGLKASIHRVSWEQAYLPVEPAYRGAAKLVIDGAVSRMTEGTAALLLFVSLRGRPDAAARVDVSWLTYALVAAAVLWVLATRMMAAIATTRECRRTPGGPGAFADLRVPDS